MHRIQLEYNGRSGHASLVRWEPEYSGSRCCPPITLAHGRPAKQPLNWQPAEMLLRYRLYASVESGGVFDH